MIITRRYQNKKKTYIDVFRDIIYQTSPLNYKINLDYISYHKKRDVWISEKFTSIFGPKREYGGKITKNFKNIAAALQKRIEEVVISQLKYCNKKYNQKKLCISGGVGLNCSLNGKIVESKIFDEIFVNLHLETLNFLWSSTVIKFKTKKN